MKKNTRSKIITWSIIGLIMVGIVALLVIRANIARKEAAQSLQTQVVEKGDLTAIVGATGTVRANQTATLTWQTNGRIELIDARIGDVVNEGDVLAALAQSSLSQSIILAQSDLVSAQKALNDLLDSDTARAQAQLNLAKAQDNYNKVRVYSVQPNTPRVTDQNKLDAARAEVTIAQDNLKNAQSYYDFFEGRPDNDVQKATALSNLTAAKNQLASVEKTLQRYLNNPNPMEISISEGEVAVAKAQMDDAQREWERLKDGTDPADIEAARARVAAIEATLNLANIMAPFNGTVTDFSGMVGDMVTANTAAFRIDDLSHMFVDVDIPEVDINKVKVGQMVTMTYDAIPINEYQGRVSEVARVGSASAGAVNFKVTIEVLNPDAQVLPGMTAAVNIVVSDLKDVLTVPNRAVRLVDGQHVVYILKNDIATRVKIGIGSSSDTLSEVVSGDLKAGDVLILNPSTDFSMLMGSGSGPF